MNKIIEYVTDPAWWFTAVFVAILVTVFGNILHHTISKQLSKISAKYASWQYTKQVEKEKVISLLVSSEFLMLAELIRNAVGTILFLFICGFYIGCYAIYSLMTIEHGLVRWVFLCNAFLAGVTMFIVAPKAIKNISISTVVLRRYYKIARENLNKTISPER